MEEFFRLLEDSFSGELYQVILSNSKVKETIQKIKIRPVMVKEELLFQETSYVGTKVFHENYTKQAIMERTAKNTENLFRQVEIETRSFRAVVLISKKGKITIKKQKNKIEQNGLKDLGMPDLSHNKVKQYILEEGKKIPFLVDLGVQTTEGKIVKSRYDKFRQINRYLEFVKDVLPSLEKDKTIRIIDFGCGKSYLTFALYYYLHEMLHYNLSVIGLDLKEDVIETCNRLKDKYGYNDLRFIRGDIASFEDTDGVDMVVSLHACDTATDYALEKAIKWNAKVIFAVPCCQHEINKQIESRILAPVLKYGIIKERISALLTDAIRANVLEEQGYETQILEFIDMEHTPKNLLIRAIRKADMALQQTAKKEQKHLETDQGLQEMEQQLHIETTLQKQLK